MPKRRVIKSKRKTILRIAMLLLILAFIIAGGAASVYLIGSASVKEAPLKEAAFTTADEYVYTGSGFLYARDDTLYNDDFLNDKNDYTRQIGAGDFHLAGSPSLQLIYNDIEFQIIGESFPKEFSGTLRSIKCAGAYIAALRADTSDVMLERVQVYDRTGATILDQPSGDQFIVDYGLYQADNDYLYILSMSLTGATPVSTITIYNVTRVSTSGVIPVQNQLIEQIRFTRNSIFAIGTNQIIRYSLADNRESYRTTVYGWKLMDYDASGKSPAFLMRPRAGEAIGTVKLITLSDDAAPSESHRMLQMPAATIGAFLMNGKLIAVTPAGYVQYDLTGKETGGARFAIEVDAAEKLDGTQLLLRKGTAYYLLNIA